MLLLGVVNLSQNAVLKKILKILQAVKTSGLTNLHIVDLTTQNASILKKPNLVKELEAVVQVRTFKACSLHVVHA